MDFRIKAYNKNGFWNDYRSYINANLAEAEKAIKAAKLAGSDLVVLPEYAICNDEYIDVKEYFSWKTLTSFFMTLVGRYDSIGYFKESALPCNNDATNCPVSTATTIGGGVANLCYISCLAKRHSIAVMLNVNEAPTFKINVFKGENQIRVYNSNFLFNSTGHMVHRYRKMHPVLEEFWYVRAGTTVGTSGPLDVFGGNAYNSLICLDLIYPDSGYRAAVNTHVFTTEWGSKYPLVSILAQQGFSRATKTNVIASNMNKPYWGTDHMGSGIYIAGKAVKYSFGPIVNPNTASDPHHVLHTDTVNPAVRPTLPVAWTDNVDVRQPGHVNPIAINRTHAARLATDYTFITKADMGGGNVAAVAQIPHAGGLKCELTGEVVFASIGDNDAFVLMAMVGIKPAAMIKLPKLPLAGQLKIGKDDRYHKVCAVFPIHKDNAVNNRTNREIWQDFGFRSHTLWKKIKLEGDVWGNNAAVIPILGTLEDKGGTWYPKPLEHTVTSEWKVNDVDNTKMHLSANWGAGNEVPLSTIGLHGVVDEDGAVDPPVVLNLEDIQLAVAEYHEEAPKVKKTNFAQMRKNPYAKLIQHNAAR